MTAETLSGLSSLRAPTSEDIDALARAAFERLPASFRRLSEGLVIQVVDFPDEETLNEMDAESEFDLLGLFRGRGLAQGGATEETGELPNMIWLYRRPLLDFWCDGEDTLDEVVTHVLVHEIGHHFGLSDADIEAIEEIGPLIDLRRPARLGAHQGPGKGWISGPSQGRHASCRVRARPDSETGPRQRAEDGASV